MNDWRYDPHNPDDEDYTYPPVRNPQDRIAELEAEVARLKVVVQAVIETRPVPAGNKLVGSYCADSM